jgi:hypothetical protein
MFVLSRQELEDLTGAKIKRLQIENLRENGIPFTIGVDGWPRVRHDSLNYSGNNFKPKLVKKPDFSKVNY